MERDSARKPPRSHRAFWGTLPSSPDEDKQSGPRPEGEVIGSRPGGKIAVSRPGP